MTSPTTPELVKWYTRARRFPQLIGRTPDGAKIWGGPYTFTQAIGAGVIALIAVNTMGLWANYGFIGNTLLLVAVTYGGVLLLGRIPVGARSPISLVAGAMHAVLAPRTGRLGGRAFRPRRPHVVRHRVVVAIDKPKPRPAALPRQRPPALASRTAKSRTAKPPTVKPRTAKPRTAIPRTAKPPTANARTANARTARHTAPKAIAAKPIAPKPTIKATVVQPPVAKRVATQPPPATHAPAVAPRPHLTGVQTLLAQGRNPSERD